MATSRAAVSHVGKIRSNNQDSGYVGRSLFVVADGMGGHAGGDVASAIATKRIADADAEHPSIDDAVQAVHEALIAANSLLAETVFEHSELTGMGTTVSALIRVGDQVGIAHIGDSRIYRFRDGRLTQVTSDHTFVQRLVDSGRITPEEAAVHPRRSVLMRVLGDVDASPEIDTRVLETFPGDRWMLCSDGLSSYVPEERIVAILSDVRDAQEAADRLVKESLEHGAPDNVTVVLTDVATGDGIDPTVEPEFVGSAAAPLMFGEVESERRPIRLPTLLLHPLKAAPPEDTHFEPEREEFLELLIEEDRRRARRRRTRWLTGVVVAILALVAAIVAGYQWTQSRYFVGIDDSGRVAIFQGIQQDLGPVSLSHVVQSSEIRPEDLPGFERGQVERTINADDFTDAYRILDRLANLAESGAGDP